MIYPVSRQLVQVGGALSFSLATDVPGAAAWAKGTGSPAGADVSADGKVTWAPTADDVGGHVLYYTCTVGGAVQYGACELVVLDVGLKLIGRTVKREPGARFNAGPRVFGATARTVYGAVGMPDGVVADVETGMLSGVFPSAPADVVVTAQDGRGASTAKVALRPQARAVVLARFRDSPVYVVEGENVVRYIDVVGGRPPYQASVVSGFPWARASMEDGVGVLHGLAAADPNGPVSVRFVDSDGETAVAETWLVELARPAIPGDGGGAENPVLPMAFNCRPVAPSTWNNVFEGVDVLGTFVASGATGAVTWAKVSGPGWLNVAQNGQVSGRSPATAARTSSTLTVRATDAAGATATCSVEVVVRHKGTLTCAGAPTLEARPGDDVVEAGSVGTIQLVTAHAEGVVTYSLGSPWQPWLDVSAAGVVSGTVPSTMLPGEYPWSFEAEDGMGFCSGVGVLRVLPLPLACSVADVRGTTGTVLTARVVVTGGTAPYTFQLDSPPAGVTHDGDLVTLAAQDAVANIPFSVRVTDAQDFESVCHGTFRVSD